MPKLVMNGVSSNWKRLQAQLGAEKPTEDPDHKLSSLKRKRSDQKIFAPRTHKRIATEKSEHDRTLGPKRRMGSWMSKPQPKPVTEEAVPTDHSRLLKEHDITAQDITAAYGSRTHRPQHHEFHDEVNGGLHPTRKAGKFVALDCEMVGTGPPPHNDHVLGRASLVNYDGDQIYDSYVQAPPNITVEDYRTFVSGIQAIHMRPGYARTYAQVQADVAKLLDGRILVGHALKNDLDVLKLGHPRRDLRDTSRHAKFRIASRGRPPALRKLAKSELGLDIQTGEHSSVEDARAAMLLFRKEKQGFEEENRKVFGQQRQPHPRLDHRSASAPVPSKSRHAPLEVDVSDEEQWNNADDSDGEGDDDDEADENGRVQPKSKPKKKTKKKKRTKRK